VNVRLMKCIDAAFGQIAASCLPGPAKQTLPSPISSYLIIRPGGIGDAALLAPTIHAIKKVSPLASITVLAEHRNAGVFALIASVDRTFCYDNPREFIQALRPRYDVVIDTEQWHRLSAVVARLVRAAVSIGFGTNLRRRMFTDTVVYSHNDYESLSFSHLLQPLGIDATASAFEIPFLEVPDAASLKAASLLQPLHDAPFVALYPGASIRERRWGADRFRQVSEMLLDAGIRTVVVGNMDDQRQGEEITCGGAGLNVAGLTSLAETAAVIKKSMLLLCGDSGLLHLAVGLGVSTVSLFGPGRARKWAPEGNHHVVITKNLTCSPCTVFGTTPPCPHDSCCMSDITVNEVVTAVKKRVNG